MAKPPVEIKENIMGLRGGGSRARKSARKTESLTMATIKANNKRAGRHWFEPGALRFFGSRVGSKLFKGKRCVYFVTSEKQPDSPNPRRYSVRQTCDRGGSIRTVGAFQGYPTRASAEAAAALMARKG